MECSYSTRYTSDFGFGSNLANLYSSVFISFLNERQIFSVFLMWLFKILKTIENFLGLFGLFDVHTFMQRYCLIIISLYFFIFRSFVYLSPAERFIFYLFYPLVRQEWWDGSLQFWIFSRFFSLYVNTWYSFFTILTSSYEADETIKTKKNKNIKKDLIF